jgi:hypothetical protein
MINGPPMINGPGRDGGQLTRQVTVASSGAAGIR